MSVESDLFDTIKALVSNRAYPDIAPDHVARPYIVYQQIGGEAPTFLERAVPSKKNARLQIVVWADTRSAAQSLILQVEAALVAATAFQALPIGASTSVYDEEAAVRGARQDFSIWSDR